MAPITLSTVDDDLKEVIQHLFEIQSAVHGYLGPETQTELVRKIKNLTLALSTLSTHTKPQPPSQDEEQKEKQEEKDNDPLLRDIQLPPEIIDYVDAARNPDIYTREFVELVQRGNQDLKGKKEAFASFRDVLAREMKSAMPECRGEVEKVLAATEGEPQGQ
ncbi:mediator of RNA polymerase II transcription subunit 10 [Aspergillus lentulus]|uniref:Mediator of RNA polymerase II transcription subunit 10 n=1 Tax=Aspergillus lentulus TaxID=293939 RepID=A0ABQ0ZY61_ASPLE|nr:mediator of RNA polymerase II transcription subunit 10 [Aspergillus lentulus]GFF30659.1 mediator of RNA polymerase II transcription subunit 10 [Aspergillus lentulus]GFF68918.1 mediator of RNA polymerase II transcription subunit 10 [Aspergillus lentulus]GFF69063.1 mediator of RNA polymerase II transcription subunit 10 [Aspergillus lentulus]GFG04439.1 mediator of RNA polymerase II transcription subunit 10 [Aspergillus lentulus]